VYDDIREECDQILLDFVQENIDKGKTTRVTSHLRALYRLVNCVYKDGAQLRGNEGNKLVLMLKNG
jgi:hypothetical protein